MKLHILGGGHGQLNAIKRAREKGFEVIVSDSNPQAPGFSLADFCSHASTFDVGAVLEDAKRFNSDFLMTTGTDQPVLTAALVSQELGLPYFLSPEQALMVTNKKVMKTTFSAASIPTLPFRMLKKDFNDSELEPLNFPLVIKPLDSQGQRGVIKVNTPEEIRKNFKRLLGFSRQSEILAEEYYPSHELTISGWVKEGQTSLLLITDRVTFDNGPHIGVCLSHRYPSRDHSRWIELEALTKKIVAMIGMENGPLYFQILSGDRGFMVNEIACRLGGAYEDEFIPHMTSVPLLDIMIDMSCQRDYNYPEASLIDKTRRGKFLSLQMFFTCPGRIKQQTGMEALNQMDHILGGRYLLPTGTQIQNRENSTQRAGYFIAVEKSPKQINQLLDEAYEKLDITDQQGSSVIIRDKRMYFPL